MHRIEKGVQENLTDSVKKRVKNHQNNFVKLFNARYHEMLPSLIVYIDDKTSIDFFKVEVLLNNMYDVVLGMASNGKIQILGYSNKRRTTENPTDILYYNLLKKEDILFTIPESLIPENMKEISHLDDCKTGNFTVIRNKALNYVSDSQIIQHYTSELSEIVTSRYSLSMQAKILTFFIGFDENDTDVEKLVNDLYNGSPFVKAGKWFDPEEQIYKFDGSNVASNFAELKREYQNKISELNNMLGINSLAVDKESGVSNIEANSSKPYVTSVANIKLSSRQHALDKLNKRFHLDIKVMYNDEVESEFREIEKLGVEEGGEL